MPIFDRRLAKEILEITCDILKKYFYYDSEKLGDFLTDFAVYLSAELLSFEQQVDRRTISQLTVDKKARLYFTSYFISAHLRFAFIEFLHFTEQELNAFESILPKYSGEKLSHETK